MGRTTNNYKIKWCNSDNFPTDFSLYNYWYAHEYIRRSRKVVIVEGPCDVWRLEEAGIHNGVGLFGGSWSESKQRMLDVVGCHNVTLVMDNDENKTGERHAENLIEELKGLYTIKVLEVPTEYKDVGEMPIDAVQKLLKGYY